MKPKPECDNCAHWSYDDYRSKRLGKNWGDCYGWMSGDSDKVDLGYTDDVPMTRWDFHCDAYKEKE